MRYFLHLFAAALTVSALVTGTYSPPTHAADTQAPANTAAAQPEQSGVYRYRLGNFEITTLSDGTVPLDLHVTLRGTSKKYIDKQLARSFLSNPVEESVNAFLIDTGTRLVLVDTDAGDFFGPSAGGKLVANLKAAGYQPSQINDILPTHIHTDHSGGLIHDGQIVFPNAIIHVGKPDVHFFLNPANQNGVNGYDKAYFRQATASLRPYEKTGQLKPFSDPTEILPGIRSIPTPGHTPGHSFYRVESKGQSVTFIGDLVHVESMQFAKPGITILYDVDQPAAARQRSKQFAMLSKSRELLAGPHLPFPGMGHIRTHDSDYKFVPINYRNRSGSN